MKARTSIPRCRRDRERDAHRHEILEAAERVFAAKGYEIATVEEIAREAEFATGTLYNFFDSKEALFLAVADRILDDLVARFDAEIEPLMHQPREAIARFVALRIEEVSMHEQFLHVFHPILRARRAAVKDAAPDARFHKFLGYRTKAIALFEEGIRQGVLHDVRAVDLLGVVEGSIRFFVKSWSVMGGDAPKPEDRVGTIERALLPLLWAHPTAAVDSTTKFTKSVKGRG